MHWTWELGVTQMGRGVFSSLLYGYNTENIQGHAVRLGILGITWRAQCCHPRPWHQWRFWDVTTEALFSQWTGLESSVCWLIQFGAKAKNFWSLPALSSTVPIYGARVKETWIKFGNLGITLESWWFWIILLKQSLWDTAETCGLACPTADAAPGLWSPCFSTLGRT